MCVSSSPEASSSATPPRPNPDHADEWPCHRFSEVVRFASPAWTTKWHSRNGLRFRGCNNAREQDLMMQATVKLVHVNLPVADVAATRAFFENHFGFHCVAEPTDANVVLTDYTGLVLTISN